MKKRVAFVFNGSGWNETTISALKKGDVFYLREPDGTLIIRHHHYHSGRIASVVFTALEDAQPDENGWLVRGRPTDQPALII